MGRVEDQQRLQINVDNSKTEDCWAPDNITSIPLIKIPGVAAQGLVTSQV